MTTIYWLRNDLRLHDNESLTNAISLGQSVLMVYCFDPRHYQILPLKFRKTSFLRFKFLCQSLENLRTNCNQKGGNLLIKIGKPEDVLPKLVKQHRATHLIYQKEIASEELTVENNLESALQNSNCEVTSIWGKTLYHPEDAPFSPKDTPLTSKSFRLKLTKNTSVRPLFETPHTLPNCPDITNWGNLPSANDLGFTAEEIIDTDQQNYLGGETFALQRLEYYTFISENLTSYRWTRNRSLGMDYSSKFSPWMATGSLSPRHIYWKVKQYEKEVKKNASTWWLIFEIVWRDYFKYLTLRFGDRIFYQGGIKNRNTKWKTDDDLFERWKNGKTGIPFVDAHMRELNITGFMSNRGRVNCASFLTRDYEIDWRWGAAWFEHKLLDYDVCSNWLNWSTQAMEIWYTNPVHQGMKYDKDGDYVKNWIPELSEISGPIIQAPWLLSPVIKKDLNAEKYPLPVEIYKKWSRSISRIQKSQNKGIQGQMDLD